MRERERMFANHSVQQFILNVFFIFLFCCIFHNLTLLLSVSLYLCRCIYVDLFVHLYDGWHFIAFQCMISEYAGFFSFFYLLQFHFIHCICMWLIFVYKYVCIWILILLLLLLFILKVFSSVTYISSDSRICNILQNKRRNKQTT